MTTSADNDKFLTMSPEDRDDIYRRNWLLALWREVKDEIDAEQRREDDMLHDLSNNRYGDA
jgi:hypothetical protein